MLPTDENKYTGASTDSTPVSESPLLAPLAVKINKFRSKRADRLKFHLKPIRSLKVRRLVVMRMYSKMERKRGDSVNILPSPSSIRCRIYLTLWVH